MKEPTIKELAIKNVKLRLPRCIAVFAVAIALCSGDCVFAAEDMWTAANRIIIDVYNNIA
jgi:hypothetical protein